jgi:hypothetical protein
VTWNIRTLPHVSFCGKLLDPISVKKSNIAETKSSSLFVGLYLQKLDVEAELCAQLHRIVRKFLQGLPVRRTLQTIPSPLVSHGDIWRQGIGFIELL